MVYTCTWSELILLRRVEDDNNDFLKTKEWVFKTSYLYILFHNFHYNFYPRPKCEFQLLCPSICPMVLNSPYTAMV